MNESNLPKGWVEVQLIELLKNFENGSRPSGGVQGIIEGIPSLGGEHINNSMGINYKNMKYVPFEFAEKLSKGEIKQNDILIVKDGATTGKTAFISKNFKYKKAFVNEHVFICRLFENINSKIVFYFLFSQIGQFRILENFTGTAQGGINKKFASNTLIPLPPKAEQERMVEKLDALFGQLEILKTHLQTVPQLLKDFRQSVLNQAVTGKLTEEWRKDKKLETKKYFEKILKDRIDNYSNLINKAKDKGERKPQKIYLHEFPKIEEIEVDLPDSWAQTNIHFLSFVTKLAGFEYSEYFDMKPEGEIPVVRAQNVQMGRFDDKNRLYISKETSDFLVRSQLHGRELLMVFIGAGTGNICLAPTNERWHLAPNVAKIDVDAINRKYLFYYLQSDLGVQNVLSRVKATAQPSLSMETIREIVVLVPPLSEQEEIVKKVESLLAKADSIEQKYLALKQEIDTLPQSILAKAFRGELVPQLPTDGSAKDLLEEIAKLKQL